MREIWRHLQAHLPGDQPTTSAEPEIPGAVIKEQLIAAFAELPPPQNQGILIEAGFNRGQKLLGAEYRRHPQAARHYVPDARPSVVMLADGLHYVPMEERSGRNLTPPRGDITGRYEVPEAEYARYQTIATTAIAANRKSPVAIEFTTNPYIIGQEMRFEEIFGPDTITLSDLHRSLQLAAKQAEYQHRIAQYAEGQSEYSAEDIAEFGYRIAIIERLLQKETVATSEFDKPEWHQLGEGRDDYERFQDAWHVIKGYAIDGGKNIVGGTGLQ